MGSKPGLAIWWRVTGQRIHYFDSSQLTITRIPKIKGAASLVIFQGIGVRRDRRTDSHVTTQFHFEKNKQQQTLQRNTIGVVPGKSFVAKKAVLS